MPSPLAGRLGPQLSVASAVLMALSLAVLRPGWGDLAAVVAIGAGVLLVVAGLQVLPERSARLGGVLTCFAGLGLTGPLTEGLATAFTGIYVLVFVYVGLTQDRGRAAALVLVGLPCWLSTNEPVDTVLLSRIPMVIGIWLVVGELLSYQTGRSRLLHEMLAERADRDALTGLFNRNGLPERLAALHPEDALVFVDLDHFKRVNDNYGHQTGDAVLADLGRVVLSVTRPGDTAVRYGGEELLVLLPRAGSAGAERFLERLQGGWRASHPELTFSAGIAAVGGHGGARALELADQALYAAKHAGRDRWENGPGGGRPGPGVDPRAALSGSGPAG